MDAERLDQAGAEPLGLGDDRGQAADLLQVGARAPICWSASPGGSAELDLALDDVQLGRQDGVGRPQLVGDPLGSTLAGSAPPPGR